MSDAALPKPRAQTAPASGKIRRFFREHGWSYAFVLPSMITFTVFVVIPVIWSFVISFQEYSLARGGTWVGLDNYYAAFRTQSRVFVTAIRNTIYYTAVTVTANIFIALVLASLIQPLSNFAKTFFRAAYYLPAVTSAVIIAIVWRWLLNATPNAPFNYILGMFGLGPVRWLADPSVALESIMLSTILTVPATGVVLFSAAMGSIPSEYYEAAELDGAGPIRRWWMITVPLIKPTTLYLVVLYTIASFEVFEKILLMTPSGVGNATQTVVFQIYQNGFVQFRYGVAAAQAFILFLMIAAVAAVQFRLFRSDVEY